MHFKVIDVYPNWKVESKNVDTLINSMGNIFIDQKAIVGNIILPSYLQMKAENKKDFH